jgi:hypothetical protein
METQIRKLDMAAVIDYDAKVDILSVKWKEDAPIRNKKLLDSDVVLEYDDKGILSA